MRNVQRLLVVLGVGLFAGLLYRVGFGEVWRELATLGWGLVPLVLGEGIAEMFHTLGWRFCLSGRLRSLPWSVLFRIRLAGYAINYLTPTATLGGEVSKGMLLAAHSPGPEAASGVLIGKVCFALAHLIFVVVGALLVLRHLPLPRALWVGMVVCGVLVGMGITAFLLLQAQGKLGGVARRVALWRPESRSLEELAQRCTAVDEALMQFYRKQPASLALALACYLAGFSIGIAQTGLFFRFLQFQVSWQIAAGIWFLGMAFDLLTFAVPLNLGTLEGTRVLVLRAFGYTAVMGVAYGLALRLVQVFWAGVGLLTHTRLSWGKTQGAGVQVAEKHRPSIKCSRRG